MAMAIEELHARVLAGDDEAIRAISEWLVRDLRRCVLAALPEVELHLVESGIDDTVMAYLRAPRRYDPNRGALLSWLTYCAINRVRDGQRSEFRRSNHERTIGVDLSGMPSIIASGDLGAERERWVQEHRAEFLSAARTPSESAFLVARLDGSPMEVQAAALGIAHASASECRAELARVWDLLCRRLRWRRAHAGRPARSKRRRSGV